MDSNLQLKVKRLNELYLKSETNNGLTEYELQEQSILRDEIITYFNFAIKKHSPNMEKRQGS